MSGGNDNCYREDIMATHFLECFMTSQLLSPPLAFWKHKPYKGKDLFFSLICSQDVVQLLGYSTCSTNPCRMNLCHNFPVKGMKWSTIPSTPILIPTSSSALVILYLVKLLKLGRTLRSITCIGLCWYSLFCSAHLFPPRDNLW